MSVATIVDFTLVAVTQEEFWQYLDCDRCGERLCQVEANDTLDVLVSVATDHLAGCEGPHYEGKTEIMVHAWHVWESSGGFDWAPTSVGPHAEADVVALTFQHEEAEVNGATSSTLCTLKVAGYDPNDKATWQSITNFLEGGIQDAIEVGHLGHIIGRFNNEPEEGSDD